MQGRPRAVIAIEAAPRYSGLLSAVALHLLVVALLLSYAPARSALVASAPIMVELISTPQVKSAPKPEPTFEIPPPPKPRPLVRRRPKPEPKPVLTVSALVPAPVVALAQPPAPPTVPVAAATAPVLVPVSAPIFNADYLNNPSPAYPRISRRLGEQGRVMLRVRVSAQGVPEEVQLKISSGFERLDGSALEAVRRWKFVPAKRGAYPVPAWVLIPISFRLEG